MTFILPRPLSYFGPFFLLFLLFLSSQVQSTSRHLDWIFSVKKEGQEPPPPPPFDSADILRENGNVPLTTIIFGSCNNESKPTNIWSSILQQEPQLFIWLGDNIYADNKLPIRFFGPDRNAGPWKITPRFVPQPLSDMERRYTMLKALPDYALLRQRVKVLGTWDDHDYGLNDAGKEWELKNETQKLALDFLDEPQDSPRRKQEGVYAAYTYGPPGKRVKVYLLDTRYNRDPLLSDGDMLGEAQWEWLAEEARSSDAQINIIGSSVQVLSNLTALAEPIISVESWSIFPSSQKRLFRTLADANLSGVMFLSGDVHFGQFLRYDCSGMGYPLYEVTSSGLGQSVEESVGGPMPALFQLVADLTPDTMRLYSDYCRNPSCVYGRHNFGRLSIDWDAAPSPTVEMSLHAEDGAIVIRHKVALAEMQVGQLADQLPLRPGEVRHHCSREVDLPWHVRRRLPLFLFSLLSLLIILGWAICIGAIRYVLGPSRGQKNKPD